MRKFLLGGVIAAALSLSSGAHATLISVGLQQSGVNSGAITTVATDSGTGSVNYGGTYGTFTFNTITATGAPATPQGTLTTNSIQTTSAGAGTITVYITQTGLTSPTGPTNFMSAFTSNVFLGSAVSVVESTLYSNTNALYDGTQLASASFTSATTANSNNSASLAATYSETTKYVITVGSGFSSVNDTITMTATAVPEPASLALLGAGLAGVGFMRRRKSNTAA